MLEKGAGREQVLEQLRKEMSQHMKSRSIPLYSILAEKAQKANIAFTPSQLIMVMAGAVGRRLRGPVLRDRGRPAASWCGRDGRRRGLHLDQQSREEAAERCSRSSSPTRWN
jgi:hypothetical protein